MAARTAVPRIAVIGGGLSGTLCSLVLQHRGLAPTVLDRGRHLGGRLAGTHFLRASDPRLMTVYESLATAGLLHLYGGRTGVLGTTGGGFLSASHVPTGLRSMNDSGTDVNAMQHRGQATDGGDFCQFIEGCDVPTFVGNLPRLCEDILRQSEIPSVSGVTVRGATPGPEGWELDIKSTTASPSTTMDYQTHYDGLVVATHDASFAANVIETIAQRELAAQAELDDASTPPLVRKLQQMSTDLHQVRKRGKAPVYTLRMTLDENDDEEDGYRIPFDAVTVPGSPYVQFLSRDTTGAPSTEKQITSTWTAVSTTAFAESVLQQQPDVLDADRLAQVQDTLLSEVTQLLAPYTNNSASDAAPPRDVSVKRWGAAFTRTSLGAHHDCLALQPWRLSVCGDFIRHISHHGTPAEAAALSGLEAGERTAAYFNTDDGGDGDDKSSA